MADQMLFLELNRTTASPRIVVDRSSRELGVRGRLLVSDPAIRVEVREARRKLRGPSDRLAALREAAARRMREMPDYPDPEDEARERTLVVEAFERLQVETTAWNAGD